ncbi:MAG: sensor histidine kinase [Sphingomonadaceae bacterium]
MQNASASPDCEHPGARIGAVAAARTDSPLFKVLTDAMPQMVWSTPPDGYHDYYNEGWYEFTGVPAGSTDGEAWNGMFHPDDQPRAWERWKRSLATGEPYEIEYRLRHHSGVYRWTLGRARPVRDARGAIVRWIGTCTDIDAAKRQAEQSEILSRELSHRIKNIFAVINGLIALSANDAPEGSAFAQKLQGRIDALGRAHEFVRPHSEKSAPVVGPVTLATLVRDIMRPYPALDTGRITIVADDIAVDDRGATPIALIFHELATNAAKYGALSMQGGAVAITLVASDAQVVMSWEETGGPAVSEPSHVGFGTQLTELSVIDQLGGTITRQWAETGLRVSIIVPRDSLAGSIHH